MRKRNIQNIARVYAVIIAMAYSGAPTETLANCVHQTTETNCENHYGQGGNNPNSADTQYCISTARQQKYRGGYVTPNSLCISWHGHILPIFDHCTPACTYY